MIDEETSVEFKRFLVMSAGVVTVIATLVLCGMTGAIEVLYSYQRVLVMLPVGAFSLGVLAGSGYGVAGWFLTELRFTVPMLKAIAVSMVVAYLVLLVMDCSTDTSRPRSRSAATATPIVASSSSG